MGHIGYSVIVVIVSIYRMTTRTQDVMFEVTENTQEKEQAA